MDIGTTLLEYGADTNAVTRQGISPVHLAAQGGSVDLVSLLLTKNASVNMGNKVTHTHTVYTQHKRFTILHSHKHIHTRTHTLTWPHRRVNLCEKDNCITHRP